MMQYKGHRSDVMARVREARHLLAPAASVTWTGTGYLRTGYQVGGSTMLSDELEHCLAGAFLQARKAGHGQLTIEHLLLAILDTPNVCDVLRACRGDPAILKQDLEKHLDLSRPPRLDAGEAHELPRTLEVQPTLGLQRVLQRAIFHVESGGKKEVGVAHVLVAIFSEKQSRAVHLMSRRNVTRLDVVNYLSGGLTRA
jgi:ATP-dependent Clp protease ATP-binding subunit ClpA